MPTNPTYTLVTGASSGIGYEFAKICADNGHNLILVARQKDKLEALAREIRQKTAVQIKILALDLADPTAPKILYEKIKQANLIVDILINNAGFGTYGKFVDLDLEQELKMIQVNVTALTALTKLFGRDMATRAQGKILNVASTAAFQPGPLMAVYYATKAYVLSLSEALANEFKASGVTVTTLCPGPTLTGFAEVARIPTDGLFSGRIPNARDVAQYGYSALMKKKRLAIYGAKNKLLIFLTRFLPRQFVTAFVRRLQERSPSKKIMK